MPPILRQRASSLCRWCESERAINGPALERCHITARSKTQCLDQLSRPPAVHTVGNDPELLDARTEVVQAFFEHGSGLIDSSLMYGSAPPTTAKLNDGH